MERFYDPTLGEVLLDGENIKKIESRMIEEATKTAHAHGFISSLEKGYETQVGRAGLTLTDEHKIKISIARAVLSNPSILLLDEVT
uniref:ABC transporter domain-containing protein n=1 Tax=Zea mays TaxID=4577 RepID=A0A804NN12_MAIZE